MNELRPVPKPPARQKRPRQWGSTLAQSSKGLPAKRKTPRRPRELACRPFLDWLHAQPCVITGLRTGNYTEWQGAMIRVEVDPAHLVKSRGAGAGDLYSALPLARFQHDLQHQIGVTSWRRLHGLTEQSVRDLCALYADEFLRKFGTKEDEDDEESHV